jgi:hypothetical protein
MRAHSRFVQTSLRLENGFFRLEFQALGRVVVVFDGVARCGRR